MIRDERHPAATEHLAAHADASTTVHPDRDHATLPIGAYAVIGNCQTAALVSTRGAVEWLCAPRFDSPSVLGAILDTRRGGRVQVRPTSPSRVRRRYIPGTNVLETEFATESGVLRVTDFMPVGPGRTDLGEPRHTPLLCRLVRCLAGRVEVDALCDPRPGFARSEPSVCHQPGWVEWRAGADRLAARTDFELRSGSGSGTSLSARCTLRRGEARAMCLDVEPRDLLSGPLLPSVEQWLATTIAWWRTWLRQLRYDGSHRDAVERSALTLKLMTHGPTGAIVAAPTTSLPERPGGVRNWDYRYCWLRDASMTMRALLDLGFSREAHDFLHWLVYRTQQRERGLHVLYHVDGSLDLEEHSLHHLRGYAGSRPVRIGNEAHEQLQFDTYGALIDAAYLFFQHGGRFSPPAAEVLRGLGEQVCDLWPRPDSGIWEFRTGPHHNTLSKAMCWVALDRLLSMHHESGLPIPVERFGRECRRIHEAVRRHGFDPSLESYTAVFGGSRSDASLLLLGLYGFEPPESPRMLGTMRRIDHTLGPPPLLHRYRLADDGLPGGEGAFGICSFWAVECLALAGRLDEAEERFSALLDYANDVGLFAEEIDPESGEALGNFPQAFTHVGVVNAALFISRARNGKAAHPPPLLPENAVI